MLIKISISSQYGSAIDIYKYSYFYKRLLLKQNACLKVYRGCIKNAGGIYKQSKPVKKGVFIYFKNILFCNLTLGRDASKPEQQFCSLLTIGGVICVVRP